MFWKDMHHTVCIEDLSSSILPFSRRRNSPRGQLPHWSIDRAASQWGNLERNVQGYVNALGANISMARHALVASLLMYLHVDFIGTHCRDETTY